MLLKTEAIVLRSFAYTDGRLISEMLCRDGGRMSFGVSVGRGGGRPSRGGQRRQLLQPLTLLELECDVRPSAGLQRVREMRLAHAYVRMPFDEGRLAQALFAAEFLLHATRGEQQGGALFDYVSASLLWLDQAPAGSATANWHLVFMMRLSRLLGFYPNLSRDDGERWFDLRGSCFCSAPPPHHDYLAPQEADRIGLLMRMDYATMHLFHMTRAERNRCVEILLAYYRLHLPQFPELQSLDVLRQLSGHGA